MIRTISLSVLALALVPIATLLLFLGVGALKPGNKRGLPLKLTLLVNTSLLIVASFLGCCGKPGNRTIPISCYAPPPITDITDIPDNFEESDDWSLIEEHMIELEERISREDFDSAIHDRFGEAVLPAIENMRAKGLLNNDDTEILIAYVASRYRYYSDVLGGTSCYAQIPTPVGKEAVKEDIVAATDELRRLYAEGKIDTPAYETALANLDGELRQYTEKEDNPTIRQLLLDIADGRTGSYE